MKKTKNLLAIVAMMLLVAMLSVAGTLAYLTAASTPVENTFTVGNITIDLKETPIGGDVTNPASLTSDGNTYKIIPGDTVVKNPTVIIEAGSEKCYVFVTVTNNMKIGDAVVATPNVDDTKWQVVSTSGNTTVYAYATNGTLTKVDASSANQYCEVFNEVTISDDVVNEENIGSLQDQTIVINAYAIQSENLPENSTIESIWALAQQ